MMQALTPLFLLIMALITNTFAMPAASAGALESRQSTGTPANLTITIFSVNECSGAPIGAYNLEYNTNSVVQTPGGIVTFYVSRDLTADEQMDFSIYAPAVTLANGYTFSPYCSKFLQTVSPGYDGEPMTSETQGRTQCYAGNGAQVSLRI